MSTPPVSTKTFDLTQNMAVRPEVLGLELQCAHAPQTIDAPRLTMVSSHLPQHVVLDHAEFPQWYTGYEESIGRYFWGRPDLREPVVVQAPIAKYTKLGGGANPKLIVVYVEQKSRVVDYFECRSYEHLSRGFGYTNHWVNSYLLTPGSIIPPDTNFSLPSNHDDNLTMMGINVATAFMSTPGTVEDAFTMSESAAHRFGFSRFYDYNVELTADVVPLNLYGDSCVYSCFPNLGENVLPDGVVMATRPIDQCGFADLADDRLFTVQPLQDCTYRMPINKFARVMDVDIWIGREFGRDQMNNPMYEQITSYFRQLVDYHNRIVTSYVQLTKQGYTCSPAFNDLVTRSLGYLGVSWRNNIPMELSRETVSELQRCFSQGRGSRAFGIYDASTESSIDFLRIDLVVSCIRNAALGSKTTGRDGCKGVCAEIKPDEDMPVDDYGFRADRIVDPRSNVARIMASPMDEQFFNRAAEFAKRQALELPTVSAQFDYIVGFLTDLDDQYGELVADTVNTQELKADFMDTVRRERIYYRIPPCAKVNLMELAGRIADKYQVKSTPVTYYIRTADGERIKIRTEAEVMIGNIYTILLNKVPEDLMLAIAVGHLNQHHIPIKPAQEQRRNSAIAQSATRWGEDEWAMILARLRQYTFRLQTLNSTSYKGVCELAKALCTHEKPSQLDSIPITDEELAQTSATLRIFHHAMGVSGVQLEPGCDEAELERFILEMSTIE